MMLLFSNRKAPSGEPFQFTECRMRKWSTFMMSLVAMILWLIAFSLTRNIRYLVIGLMFLILGILSLCKDRNDE